MADANDIFAEAISVVPLVHAPVKQDQNALIIGSHALPAAGLAARYPSFVDIAVMNASTARFGKNKRIRSISGMDDLQKLWTADLVVVAEPIISDETITMARAVSDRNTVVVFAVNEFSDGGDMRKKIAKKWKNSLPYREHLPRPALFLMASDAPIQQQRKVPEGTLRMQKSYIASLFSLAKDEYTMLYGGA